MLSGFVGTVIVGAVPFRWWLEEADHHMLVMASRMQIIGQTSSKLLAFLKAVVVATLK